MRSSPTRCLMALFRPITAPGRCPTHDLRIPQEGSRRQGSEPTNCFVRKTWAGRAMPCHAMRPGGSPGSRCLTADVTQRALRARLCRGTSGSNKLLHIRQCWLHAVSTAPRHVELSQLRPDTSSKSVVRWHRHHEPSTCQKRTNLLALPNSRKPGQHPPFPSCIVLRLYHSRARLHRGSNMMAAWRARRSRHAGNLQDAGHAICEFCRGAVDMRPCQ